MTSEEFRRNCEERVLLARRAGPFIPVEKLFPGWTGARILLMTLIPRRWSFYAAPGSLNLDLTFIANLILQAPAEHTRTMNDRLKGIELVIMGLMDLPGLEKVLVGRDNSAKAATLAGTLMENTEVLVAARGFPTLQDIIRHRVGLKALKPSSSDMTLIWNWDKS